MLFSSWPGDQSIEWFGIRFMFLLSQFLMVVCLSVLFISGCVFLLSLIFLIHLSGRSRHQGSAPVFTTLFPSNIVCLFILLKSSSVF